MEKSVKLGMMVIEMYTVLLFAGGTSFGTELIWNFEEDTGCWVPVGETTLTRDDKEKHDGNYSIRISAGEGQTNTARISVEPGGEYLIEMWVKIDPTLSGKIQADVTLWDEQKKYTGCAPIIGIVSKPGEWSKVSKILDIPMEVHSLFIRALPADFQGEGKIAWWIDDVRLKKVLDTVATREVLQFDPAGKGHRPSQYRSDWFKTTPTIDFEDMSGWKMEICGEVDAECYRSQKELLQGSYTARLRYKNGKASDYVDLIPPAPVSINEKWDKVEIWLCGFSDPTDDGPVVTVFVEDGKGTEYVIPVGQINWTDWATIEVKPPVSVVQPTKVKKIRISNLVADTEERTIYLDNLVFAQ
ncbi:MAG: carbohydrate binding domain-containing protein [Candidatus Omnitrophota bacterium]